MLAALAILGALPCVSHADDGAGSKLTSDFVPTTYPKSDLYPLPMVQNSGCGLDETLAGCDGVRALTPAGEATLGYLKSKEALAKAIEAGVRWQRSREAPARVWEDISQRFGLDERATRGLALSQEESAARERHCRETEIGDLRRQLKLWEYKLLVKGWARRIGDRLDFLIEEGKDFRAVHYWPVEESRP